MTPGPGLRERLGAVLRKTAARLGRSLDAIAAAGSAGAAADRRATTESVEEVLLEADVGVAATERILAGIDAEGGAAGGPPLRERVRREMLRILSALPPPPPAAAVPRVVLVVGVNGAGKTTTVGKLAALLRRGKAAGRSSAPRIRFARRQSSSWRRGRGGPAWTW